MRAKAVIILLIIAVLLGGYVYFFEIYRTAPSSPTDQARFVFPRFAPDAEKLADKVTSFQIDRKDVSMQFDHTPVGPGRVESAWFNFLPSNRRCLATFRRKSEAMRIDGC